MSRASERWSGFSSDLPPPKRNDPEPQWPWVVIALVLVGLALASALLK